MARAASIVRGRAGRRGNSLTEFVIMVPTIILMLWMAIYFYELITVKLKTQEIARFAAWEFTAYPEHDYQSGDTRTSIVTAEVEAHTMDLYEDLDSSDRRSTGADREANQFLATEWELRPIRIVSLPPPDVTGEFLGELGLTAILTIEAWVESMLTSVDNVYASPPVIWLTRSVNSAPRHWKFNTRGYVRSTAMVTVSNLFVPQRFRDVTSLEHERDRWVRPVVRFRETVCLETDSWRLNDGRDVRHRDRSGGMYEQVNRIFLINERRSTLLRTKARAIRTAVQTESLDFSIPDAMDPVVVSLNHHEREDGRTNLTVDGGRSRFDTAPLTVPHPQESGSGNWEPYQETLDNRGEWFMGCEEPMNASCGAGLGTENPFGDGVHWPPPGGG